MKKLFKILRLPERIPADKRLHMLVGVVLVSILTIFTVSPYLIPIPLIFVAWGIEFFQLITKSGQYDNYDALAVVIGGLLVLAPYLIKGL